MKRALENKPAPAPKKPKYEKPIWVHDWWGLRTYSS